MKIPPPPLLPHVRIVPEKLAPPSAVQDRIVPSGMRTGTVLDIGSRMIGVGGTKR
jgi:hypothetical protein